MVEELFQAKMTLLDSTYHMVHMPSNYRFSLLKFYALLSGYFMLNWLSIIVLQCTIVSMRFVF